MLATPVIAAVLGRPVAFGGLAAGLALGVVLGSIALRKTVFEQAGDGDPGGLLHDLRERAGWRKREAIN